MSPCIIIASPDQRCRARLTRLLGGKVTANIVEAATLRDTFNLTEERDPTLVIVDDVLATLPEFRAVQMLFTAIDTRWLTLCTRPGDGRSAIAPTASGLFCLDLTAPPQRILEQVRAVVRNPKKRVSGAPAPSPSAGRSWRRLALIGSSTGGIEALIRILSEYPAQCPPTAIVQHTGQGFGDSLTKLLARNCAAEVRPMEPGLEMRPGRVVIAAGTPRHMELAGASGPPALRFTHAGPVAGHCPSVDALFHSAVPRARKVVGVLLTGMGSDGAQGLLALRRAGAMTLAQDEASSVVYGMPRVAFERGAVCEQVPIGGIAAAILKTAAASSGAGAEPRTGARA
ncbi:CheB methylesterase domain-containing protein [Pseudoroseicyclus tamaricis]|uniref:protein-glutamate methylesterase n=1 Tax=Pseudoroseicyclus tamaricis TaxID=2705421 RepID=A0A6B2K074_9RHOB|nr:CheB methylesterase domain-containing protein [Pseudoroseicyclus tamaricis]NDV01844.1 chemotaxis protein CheB [Pseudoroseicyclus tamaricis]